MRITEKIKFARDRFTDIAPTCLRTDRLARSSHPIQVLKLGGCQGHVFTTELEKNDIVRTRNKDGSKQHLVQLRVFDDF